MNYAVAKLIKLNYRRGKMGKASKINNYTEFYYHLFRNVLIVSVPLLAIVSLALSLPHSSATVSSDLSSSADHLNFAIPVSCTLVSNVEETHSATLLNGTYKDNIGKTIMTTYCNDSNGYTIYVASPAFNVNNQSILVSSINSDYDIVTGTATSGADSAWAMKLSKSNINTNIDSNGNTVTTNNIVTNVGNDSPAIDPGFEDKYVAVPANWTPVVSKASGTVSSQTGASFTTTYAAYTSTTQPAGTYAGLVRYLLLHDNQSIPTPTYFMQDVAFWKGSLSTNQSVQAIDERDGKKYWVTKMSDGNIWMTQNLDLCIGCDGVATLTSENTDISTDSTISGAGIYGATGGYSESGGVWTWTPANTSITSSINVDYNANKATGWGGQNTAPMSAEGGDIYFYTSEDNNPDTRYDSLDLCKVDHSEADCLHYHVGNYYNWTAAVASNNSGGISTNKARASNSLCPRGWRLPNTDTTDNAYNEFGRLLYGYNVTNNIAGSGSVGYKTGGFNTIRVSPLWFVRSGYLNNGSLDYPATSDSYWSNTVNDDSSVYYLYLNSSIIYPARSDNGNRYYGRSIRCVARREN